VHATDVLRELLCRGYEVMAAGDELRVRPAALDDALCAVIRAHRAALIRVLAPGPCPFCGALCRLEGASWLPGLWYWVCERLPAHAGTQLWLDTGPAQHSHDGGRSQRYLS
jgi:hypothetical protein